MKKPKTQLEFRSIPSPIYALHYLFIFALLNLCLHCRVELLVLVSRPLEFRVLITVVTATLADHCHHILPPNSAAIHPAIINPKTPPPTSYRDTDPITFPAAARVRVELLFPSFSFYFPSLLFLC